MNRKKPSVMKYAINQKTEVSNQEKQACYPKSNNVKDRIITKGPLGIRNLGNTCNISVSYSRTFIIK